MPHWAAVCCRPKPPVQVSCGQHPACSHHDAICVAAAYFCDISLLVLRPSIEGSDFKCPVTLYTPTLELSGGLPGGGKAALVVCDRPHNTSAAVKPPAVPINLLLLSGVTDDALTLMLCVGAAAVSCAAATLLPSSYDGADTGVRAWPWCMYGPAQVLQCRMDLHVILCVFGRLVA